MAKYESPFADLLEAPLPGEVVDEFLFELKKFAAYEQEASGRASAHEALKLAATQRALGRAKTARLDRHRPAGLLQKLAVAMEGARAALEPSPEQVALAEQQSLLAQTLNENQALKGQIGELGGQLEQHAMAAEQAGQEAAQLGEQLQGAEAQAEETSMQAQEAMAQAQMAQTEAQVHAQNAAQQAEGKMRLAIRIQQMRQQLADLASQDPVTEEGEEADPIETQTQQMGAAPEDLAAEQEAAAAGGAPGGGAAQAGQGAAAKPKPAPAKPKPAGGEGGAEKAAHKVAGLPPWLAKYPRSTRAAAAAKKKSVPTSASKMPPPKKDAPRLEHEAARKGTEKTSALGVKLAAAALRARYKLAASISQAKGRGGRNGTGQPA